MTAPALRLPEEASTTLQRGVRALLQMQQQDGSWEGECVWCPMLTAQYAITAHVIGLEVTPARRAGMLAHFQSTRNQAGVWGLHPDDDGSLFVTTLVYVAARLLGALPTAPWLSGARQMFEAEKGVQRIPTWGKVWLAMLDLYGWEGVNPILPELWALPSWVPVHPANYYCHTRSIYLGLAVLYGTRFVAPRVRVIDELRGELYPEDYDRIEFAVFASEVREADAPFRAGWALRGLFAAARQYDRRFSHELRSKVLTELRAAMRRDLRMSDHLSLSPVNGLLTILALSTTDREDADLHRAIDRFDAWFWEDPVEGSRVAGAGSVCWDTSFALQALAIPADTDPSVSRALDEGTAFLASQQIEHVGSGHRAAFRIEPSGGWCFSEVRHGWPVSDCTAEAVLALLHARPESLDREHAARAARFILRCQNHDGGFGSYEPRKTRFPLEWMNPAEMFGRCMTERSYVECTASCLMALAEIRTRFSGLLSQPIAGAIARAAHFLAASQLPDGSWDAAWGVRYVYATMFGIRGLVAAGTPTTDDRIRRACGWLLEHQRPDGGWGERLPGEPSAGFTPAESSSSIQTAWALLALCEADAPNATALSRAARCLQSLQLDDGQWPDGEFVGVFFETALLNYRLYRQYFPVMALAIYERRRTEPTP